MNNYEGTEEVRPSSVFFFFKLKKAQRLLNAVSRRKRHEYDYKWNWE